jgi:tetratricopeptide (TPR) repeat protein
MQLAVILAAALASSSQLDRAEEHLSKFEVEQALALLQEAVSQGPYGYADYVRLYEQLGIAYAYAGREREADAAFDMLLTLDPGHAIDYTLSPKVTFVFERARERAAGRLVPALAVSWPRGLTVAQPIPVIVEVVADPKRFMDSAVIYSRTKGSDAYTGTEVELGGPGAYRTVELPPAAPRATAAETIELYVVARDQRGNEVSTVADAAHPRELALSYEEPVPLYKRWWLWAAVGGVVAATTGVILLATRDPSADVGGGFHWR